MSCLRVCIVSFVPFSSIPAASAAGGQGATVVNSQPAVKQLQLEIEELRQGSIDGSSEAFRSNTSTTVDWVSNQYITRRIEYNYRLSSVQHFSDPSAVTPPCGDTGTPGSVARGWTPDVRPSWQSNDTAVLMKV